MYENDVLYMYNINFIYNINKIIVKRNGEMFAKKLLLLISISNKLIIAN